MPSPPTLSTPSNGAVGQSTLLTLTWVSVVGAVSYKVQVSRNSGFTDLVIDEDKADSQYTDLILTYKHTYYWRVNVSDASGTSGWSSVWSFDTIELVPFTTYNKGVKYPAAWQIFKLVAGAWVKDYDLPNPNFARVILEEVSTIKRETLTDGDEGFIIPEKRSKKQDIQLAWARKEDYNDGLKDQLDTDYLQSGTKLRIVTPYGDTYEGQISRLEAHMIPGMRYRNSRKKHTLILTFVQDNT